MASVVKVMRARWNVLDRLTANGQLSRRVLPIHYPRYGSESGIIRMFGDTLQHFVDKMPIPEAAKKVISQHEQFLWESTVGCIGTLSNVLSRICWRSLKVHNGIVDHKVIKTCALKAGCSRIIQEEILAGELQYQELLSDSQNFNAVGSRKRPLRLGRVGHRKLQRDPVEVK